MGQQTKRQARYFSGVTERGPGIGLALTQAAFVFMRSCSHSPIHTHAGSPPIERGGRQFPRYRKAILTQSGSNTCCKQKGQDENTLKEQRKFPATGLCNSQRWDQKHQQQMKWKNLLCIKTQTSQRSSSPRNRRTHVNHVSDSDECHFPNLGFNGSKACQVPKANVLPQGYKASFPPRASTHSWTEINHNVR